MKLKASDFDYPLASERIAQTPLARRDLARLMVLRRADGHIAHRVFCDLPELLREGDLLVLNDTQVIPAKFACRRRTGAKIEGLFVREVNPACWEVLLRNAGRCRIGEPLPLIGDEQRELHLLEDLGSGRWLTNVDPSAPAVEILHRVGSTPLPPYIRCEDSSADAADRSRYQTLYASRPGAVAAPTAGLHFTDEVFQRLTERGIDTARVTLHVGPGTFAPVKCEDLSQHEMHSEWYELPSEAATKLNAARGSRRRVVAVGSTSLRVLESAAGRHPGCDIVSESGWTNLFVYPPAEFGVVDAMITNFHLPRSTLLMLVAAFCSPGDSNGLEMILSAYRQADRRGYRFYSYGDAMLIE